MSPVKKNNPHIYKIHPYTSACIMVILAALLRIGLFNQLGQEQLWFTFYLAVLLSTFDGGFVSGLLSILLSSLFIFYGWKLFTDQPFIDDGTMHINSALGKGCKMEIKFPLKSWEAV